MQWRAPDREEVGQVGGSKVDEEGSSGVDVEEMGGMVSG
jgi:hypothetical protein